MTPDQSERKQRVRSPCVAICVLDDKDICVGCHRSGDEIMCWTQFTDDERRTVLARVAEREKSVLL